MREKMTRREFLKSTGVTAAAIAAAGMLAACGGGGDAPIPSDPTPDPSVKPTADDPVVGKITIKENISTETKAKIDLAAGQVLGWSVGFSTKSSETVTLDKNSFKAVMGSEELVFLGFFDSEKSKSEKKTILTDTITLKAGDSWVYVRPFFRVSEKVYKEGGTCTVTVMNDGKSYSVTKKISPKNSLI